MSTWTGTTKNSASFSNQSATASTMTAVPKVGSSWKYNQTGYTYNQISDLFSSVRISYNGIGSSGSFSNLAKN